MEKALQITKKVWRTDKLFLSEKLPLMQRYINKRF